MTLREAIEKLKGVNPEKLKGATGRIGFLVEGGEPERFVIFLQSGGIEVLEGESESDCFIRLNIESFRALLAGQASPLSLFMSGKIELTGVLAYAAKLNELFGGD